jgi:peptide/nickel transport system permease protein
MWGVTLLTFALMNLLPGGAATALAGPGATRQQIHEIAVRLHLNEPFIVRYLHWLGGAITGHLGNSLANGQPVSAILAQRLPVTAEMVGIAMLASVVFAVPLAVLAVHRPRGITDRVSILLAISGLAIPGFVLGIILILVVGVHWRLLPPIGFTPLSAGLWPNLRTLILPTATLAFPLFCLYTRVLRADLLDQLNSEDYIVTAIAKGLTPIQVLVRHAFRNSLFNFLTLVGLNLGVLIGGTVLIEQIFDVPGMGQELIQAIQDQDVIVVEAIVVVLALAVVITSLLTDVVYSVLDPRIRYGGSGS